MSRSGGVSVNGSYHQENLPEQRLCSAAKLVRGVRRSGFFGEAASFRRLCSQRNACLCQAQGIGVFMQWFSKRSIAGEFLQLSIPTVLAGWIYAIYSVADGVFIGRYIGSQALAALNLALPVLYVPYAFGLLIGVGAPH